MADYLEFEKPIQELDNEIHKVEKNEPENIIKIKKSLIFLL